jgi:sugar lactone lactonase YvrE
MQSMAIARQRTRIVMFAALLLAAVGVPYLLLWPVGIDPVAWEAPVSRGYTGAHAVNQRLADLQGIALDGQHGPEHIVLGRDDWLYVSVAGGSVLRMRPDGTDRAVFASTGGRMLGFDLDAAGNLLVADAMRGLLAIDQRGNVRLLADHVDGDPIRYANSVIVAADGTVYFSDSSTRFSPAEHGGTFEASVLDIIEQSRTGRVLAYAPSSGSVAVVARGLSFANGVAMSSDQRSLLVVETGRYRVWRIDASARGLDLTRDTPQAQVLLDNLPGYPDNLLRGRDGRIWLGLAKPRSAMVDWMADKPWLRRVTLRLPRALWPVPKPYGHIIAFDDAGRIVADLQDPTGAYPETTGATETGQRLYVQSLHADRIGWLPADAIVR